MAAKTDFTADEWDALQKGVTGAGMLVSLADPGFFDNFKEVGALTKHLSEARGNSTNPLIGEVAQVRGTGFGLTSSLQSFWFSYKRSCISQKWFCTLAASAA